MATPKKVSVYQADDGDKSCKQLRKEYQDAHELREIAQAERGSGEQLARWVLFFPSGIVSANNAKAAIRSAEDRMKRLDTIMADKKCKKY